MAKKRKLGSAAADPSNPYEDSDQKLESEEQQELNVEEQQETEQAAAKKAKSESPEESEEAEEENEGDENSDDEEDEAAEEEEEELEEEPMEKILEPFSKEQLVALLKEAVAKYPEFNSSVLKIADVDPAHRKIFVHGLGWDATVETLKSVFGKYGEIEDVKAVMDKITGKSKGYAFILYKHRSGARKALMEPQKKIGIRLTSCQLASAGPVQAQNQSQVQTLVSAAVAAPVAAAGPVSEYTQRKIFVSNVAADIDPAKLLEFFRQFGEIEEGPLGFDKQTSKPKGFALFVYRTVEGARKALEEPHKVFEGHNLHCQKAIDGPKPNKFQNQQHVQQLTYPPNYNHRKEKQHKYQPRGQAQTYSQGRGHLMIPAQGVGGFNQAVAAQAMNPALGQALTALMATQGAGMGLSNLLGGIGGQTMNQPGIPISHNAGYVNTASLGFGNPQIMQGGYQNSQMGQGSGSRPPPGLHMSGHPYLGQ